MRTVGDDLGTFLKALHAWVAYSGTAVRDYYRDHMPDELDDFLSAEEALLTILADMERRIEEERRREMEQFQNIRERLEGGKYG